MKKDVDSAVLIEKYNVIKVKISSNIFSIFLMGNEMSSKSRILCYEEFCVKIIKVMRVN